MDTHLFVYSLSLIFLSFLLYLALEFVQLCNVLSFLVLTNTHIETVVRLLNRDYGQIVESRLWSDR